MLIALLIGVVQHYNKGGLLIQYYTGSFGQLRKGPQVIDQIVLLLEIHQNCIYYEALILVHGSFGHDRQLPFVLIIFSVIGITMSQVSGWTHGLDIILLHCLSYPLLDMMTWKVHLSITIYQIYFSQDMSLHWLYHRGMMRNQIIGQHVV